MVGCYPRRQEVQSRPPESNANPSPATPQMLPSHAQKLMLVRRIRIQAQRDRAFGPCAGLQRSLGSGHRFQRRQRGQGFGATRPAHFRLRPEADADRRTPGSAEDRAAKIIRERHARDAGGCEWLTYPYSSRRWRRGTRLPASEPTDCSTLSFSAKYAGCSGTKYQKVPQRKGLPILGSRIRPLFRPPT